MRLIDADEVEYNLGTSDRDIYVKYTLEEAPTVDAAPIIHARWMSLPHKRARVCSRCEQDEPYKFTDEDTNVYNYCPNCGAKMDGKI